MPKYDAKAEAEITLTLTSQAEIKKQTSALLVDGKGLALRELEISFSRADYEPSGKGELVAALLKRTPNLAKLSLNFSGYLGNKGCLGESLLQALCSLKDLEEFHHGRTTSMLTDFGQYNLMKLVSSWPKLRVLYLSGDSSNDREGCEELPPAVCALESVTFERCMANFDLLAPMFAGSSESLRYFESWSMGHKKIDAILLPMIPAIETLKLGGCDHPTPSFITEHLSRAPKLSSISLGGSDDCSGAVRKALTTALKKPDTFPMLRHLAYPGKSGTYKTGRGRNVRVHEHENIGEDELCKAARERGLGVSTAHELEYKVEGAQRRAGFAAMSRRGW